MPNYNIKELPFTTAELEFFEGQMRKYKVPWIYKIVFGSLYKWAKYFMPAIFLVIAVLAIIHVSSNIDLFNVIKIFAFFWIFFIGGAVLIAFIAQRIKVLANCKRLGLTLNQWNALITTFQIKYI
jgi:hypothetical protein